MRASVRTTFIRGRAAAQGIGPCVALVVALLVSLAASGAGRSAPARQLTLADRVACQRSIEEVYWHHRAWPADARAMRPSFDDAVPAAVVGTKAGDAVRKSVALKRLWHVEISPAQLQAELDRIGAATKAPGVLRELFAALGNDPFLAAECLARPLLADRLIRAQYSQDDRFHGALRARARAELANVRPGTLQETSGRYSEVEWQRGRGADAEPGAIVLDSPTFDERVRALER